MKTFNEFQMLDPWAWCREIIGKHEISSKMTAEITGMPRSTIRALFNGTNHSPRYEMLTAILLMCVQIETNGGQFLEREPVRAASKQPEIGTPVPKIEDFL